MEALEVNFLTTEFHDTVFVEYANIEQSFACFYYMLLYNKHGHIFV